jgi:hypothetical protein
MVESPADSHGTRVDAVIVPASRPVSWLDPAMRLARALDCVLVVICSRKVAAEDVTVLAEQVGVTTVAVDMPADIGIGGNLGTSVLLEGSSFERLSDASDKRNQGLQLAWLCGWDRVIFLDDDIYDIVPPDVTGAATLLDRYRAVGLENVGFPDNSVVCHAYRTVGGRQEQFIGSGALAVSPLRTRSFFPKIYNQDWLFLVGHTVPPRLAVTGRVRQAEFDPFADPARARGEEFGDCLAEGLYWLLDRHRRLEGADREYWKHFLTRRRRFLDRLLWLANRPVDYGVPRVRLVTSLEAAKAANALITADLCAEYLSRWRSDLVTWRRHLDGLPTGVGIERAVAELGLES